LKKVKFKRRRKMNSMKKEECPNKYTMRMALTVEEGDVVSNNQKKKHATLSLGEVTIKISENHMRLKEKVNLTSLG